MEKSRPDKKRLLERYHSRLIALERRAPLTAETYRIEIRKFLDWLEGEENGRDENAAPSLTGGRNDFTKYLSYRRSVDRLDSRSVAKAISALRSFGRFLEDEGYAGSTACADKLESPRPRYRLPEVYSQVEVDGLLGNITVESPLGLRNRALYEFIFSSGLRISETVSLNLTDIIFDEELAQVRGKGDKERIIVFGPDASYWLKRYLKEARPELAGVRISKALFLNKYGKRLSRKGMWKNYNRIARKAGLGTKLHTLRHTFATELLAGGADLRSVQELLGHADITTTQIYTHVDQSRLRDNHNKYLPNLKNWSAANEA